MDERNIADLTREAGRPSVGERNIAALTPADAEAGSEREREGSARAEPEALRLAHRPAIVPPSSAALYASSTLEAPAVSVIAPASRALPAEALQPF